jgi:RNA polymerase sigma-70 factor (ECF subfamily)
MTDTARFEGFVREYQDMVYATAVRLLGSPADAEDVSQTVFLRAFERFEAVGQSAGAAGWLKTVTTNLCLNHLSRYRKRWQFFSELDSAGGADHERGSYADRLPADDDPGQDLDRAHLHQRLERALRDLPDHQRVPLVLFHFEGMTYKAIAGALGISLAKVKTDIHRGRHALKIALTVQHEAH